MAATTWDPNAKAAGITLSGGNLVATAASGTNPGVFATRTITGKSYWEITASVIAATMAIGVANRSWNDASGTLLGGDANGLAFRQDGTVKLNNANLTTIQIYAAGDVVQVALDPFGVLVWFNVNNGNWNNSGAANPATGVGGIDYSSMSYGVLLPAFGASTTTGKGTAVFSSGSFSFTAPTGFSSVDAIGASGIAAELVAATPDYVGAARLDAVTTHVQLTAYPAAAGAWYGIGGNTPATAVRLWTPAAAATNVSGTLTESGSPAARKVRLYDHNTGEFLGETTSSAIDGSYSIPGLGRTKTVVVALDDPNFNALVYDDVAPV